MRPQGRGPVLRPNCGVQDLTIEPETLNPKSSMWLLLAVTSTPHLLLFLTPAPASQMS